VARTQAIYYRDESGAEPVDEFIERLPAKRAAKIDDFVEEFLNGRKVDAPRRSIRLVRRSKANCAS
jgi:hypothetical protein